MNRGLTQAELVALATAVAKVESNNDRYAIGDDGKAYGCLQVRQAALDDYNKQNRTAEIYYELSGEETPPEEKPWTLEDMFDPRKAFEVFAWYIGYYSENTWARHGVMTDLEHAARIWNGGPYGYAKPSTLPYWEKVKKELYNEEE